MHAILQYIIQGKINKRDTQIILALYLYNKCTFDFLLEQTQLTRNHLYAHLKKLISSDIVVKCGNEYMLNESTNSVLEKYQICTKSTKNVLEEYENCTNSTEIVPNEYKNCTSSTNLVPQDEHTLEAEKISDLNINTTGKNETEQKNYYNNFFVKNNINNIKNNKKNKNKNNKNILNIKQNFLKENFVNDNIFEHDILNKLSVLPLNVNEKIILFHYLQYAGVSDVSVADVECVQNIYKAFSSAKFHPKKIENAVKDYLRRLSARGKLVSLQEIEKWAWGRTAKLRQKYQQMQNLNVDKVVEAILTKWKTH